MYLFLLIFLALSVNLESFLGSSPIVDLLPTCLVLYGVCRHAFIGEGSLYVGSHWDKKNLTVFFLYTFLFAVSIIRINTAGTNNDGMVGLFNTVIKQVLFVVYCYLYFCDEFRKGFDFQKTAVKLIAVVMLTIAFDYSFWTLLYVFAHNSGGSMAEVEYNFILGRMGISFERKLIPIIQAHPNSIGMYVGSVVAMLMVFFLVVDKKGIPRRLVNLLKVALGFGILFVFLVDSRSTLLNSILIIPSIIFVCVKTGKVRLLKYLVYLVPLFPFLMLFVLSFLAQTDLVGQFSRQEGDLATGNNRSVIWDACVNELAAVKPVHFWGYGANGQIGADIDKYYSQFFNVKGMIVHNVFFQTVLDMGYLGTFLFMSVLFIAMRNAQKLYQQGNGIAICLMAFFVYYLASGTTESTHGVYNQTYNTCMVIMVILTMVIYDEANTLASAPLQQQPSNRLSRKTA